ncbi:cyclophilin-like fold protein [Undibacterium rivi]|uniref:cyclophilin-like fold protein n=1 Tax=Undibacterium rivi TaxID=2828729 RepID=UPI001E59ADF7|nr:cyclophilin-like fold protein [Undibacterium rivi]
MNRKYRWIKSGWLAVGLIFSFTVCADTNRPYDTYCNLARPITSLANQTIKMLKIRITVNGEMVIATLADNPTAKDFYSLLPLTLSLNDYAATEKIAYLTRKLSKAGAPAGSEPAIGDIAYYAPWGNLAIFYKNFAYSEGLIKLGKIDSGLESFKKDGLLKVTIEPISNTQ